MAHKIESFWAILGEDKDGNEGLVSLPTPEGKLPLIAGDLQRLEIIKTMARGLIKSGKAKTKLKLAKFTYRETLDEDFQ